MFDTMGWHALLQPTFVALHLAAFALLITVTIAWGRHGRRRYFAASGLLTVLAITAIYLATVHPRDIPVDWITVIHEGMGVPTILHLYTRGVHTGENFPLIVQAIAAGPTPTLHDVVWLNLLLAMVNAVVFLHFAIYIAGPLWALPWTLVFALNPAMFMASFSELPMHLLGFYFLASVLAWATLQDSRPQPRVIRAFAWILGVILTVLVANTRLELVMIGAIALALHAAEGIFGDEGMSAAEAYLRRLAEAAFAFLNAHRLVLIGLCALGVVLTKSGIPELVHREPVGGLYPFNPFIFSVFFFLPMLLLPIGVGVAVLFGFIHAAIHFRRFGGLALSLFILVRMFFVAQNQYFEMGRYLGNILPAIFVLGLYGKRVFEAITRRWTPMWHNVAQVAYVLAWFSLPLPGAVDFYIRPEYDPKGGFSQLLLDMNLQREIRYLVTLMEKNPQCVFVTRVLASYHFPRDHPEYTFAVFGKPVAHPAFVDEKDATLDEVIAQYAAEAACVQLFVGSDCGLTYTGDHCEKFVAGRRLLDEHRSWSRPYNAPLQSGYVAPELVLRTYAWP